MRFRESLWTDSEPDYAPGLSKSKSFFYWKAPKKYVDLGCTVTRQRLTGTAGDGQDMLRAAECRALTRDMLAQFMVEEPTLEPGTWKWLFHIYRTDPASTYHDIKGNSRRGYDQLIDIWIEAIGDAQISQANFRAVKRWEQAMQENGRSTDHIHRRFSTMRRVVRFGAALEIAECQRFAQVLSGMRFKMAKPKDTSGTPEQVEAVIRAAEEGGDRLLAIAWWLQYWFSLRPVDVRGQWINLKRMEKPSGIVWRNQRWQDGMTWDMIDPGFTKITKLISKTAGTTRTTITLDLTLVPEVREALMSVAPDERVGPIFVDPETGRPFRSDKYAKKWAHYRSIAGVPESVKNMGIRPTALTDGDRAGASAFQLRDAAGHADVHTTNRYIRHGDEAAANVVKMRRGGRE